MFLFGQYSHASACCKKAQPFLGLTQIFPLANLTPLPLLFSTPYEVPSHGKYNQLRVELLQRCLRELEAQVLLIFNVAFAPTSPGWKWWLHHSCLPLHLHLTAFVVHSPCIQPHIQGSQNQEQIQITTTTRKQILTAGSQRRDANSKIGFPLHPGHECLASNMPQMLLPSLNLSCALEDNGATGPYCKSDSLWTGSITLVVKSHLTPHCLSQLDTVCSNALLLHKLSVWWTASGVTTGPSPSIFSLDRWSQI